MKKAKDSVRYNYVPAAYSMSNMYGLGMYVRYRRGPHGVTKLFQDPATLVISTPDRELTLVRYMRQDQHHPCEGNYDEFVNLNLYSDHAANDLGFEWFMTNYTDFINKEDKGPRTRVVRDPSVQKIKIISDSGGFQLYSNKLDFINPYKIGSWYSDNADIGIVLDIPLASGIKSKDYLLRFAKLQKKNTKIIRESVVPEFELMNVVHGVGFEDKMAYHEVVGDSAITRLAVGGNYMDTLFAGVSKFLSLHSGLGSHYKHYHMLGVTNVLQIVMYMRMVHVGLVPYMTSDSSTYYQKAVSKEYLSQNRILSNISHLNIGAKDNLASEHTTLSCACPVCSRIRYTDIFSQFTGSVLNATVAFHNAWRFNEYLRTMYEVMQRPLPEVKKVLTSQMGKRSGLEEAIKTIEFIDAVANTSLTKAKKKFAYYDRDLASAFHNKESSLFDSAGETDGFVSVDSSKGSTQENKIVLKRADFILSKYEKFDRHTKNEEKGKDVKLTTKIHSSKAHKRKKL